MSDQANEQSPQSRLEAMLDTVEDQDVIVEEKQPPVEADETEVETETTDEEATEDAPDDQAEEEGDSQEETPALLKLKVNGEEIEKPLDEVVALAQQGLDYTKKTQEVAEQRKELEAYSQNIKVQEENFRQQVELQNMLIGEIAQITALDQQLSQYANVNWNQLSDSDFVEAQKLFFTYNQLQQERSTLVSQFEAKKHAVPSRDEGQQLN